MQPATGVEQGLGQQMQVGALAWIILKAGQAVVAALDDVLWDAGCCPAAAGDK